MVPLSEKQKQLRREWAAYRRQHRTPKQRERDSQLAAGRNARRRQIGQPIKRQPTQLPTNNYAASVPLDNQSTQIVAGSSAELHHEEQSKIVEGTASSNATRNLQMVQQGLPEKLSVVIDVPEYLQLAPTAQVQQMIQNGALFR